MPCQNGSLLPLNNRPAHLELFAVCMEYLRKGLWNIYNETNEHAILAHRRPQDSLSRYQPLESSSHIKVNHGSLKSKFYQNSFYGANTV